MEGADIVASDVRCPTEVELENIKSFEVSHHYAQTQTLFSNLILSEIAEIKFHTTWKDSKDDIDPARVLFPSEWPASSQVREQHKLELDMYGKEVTYRIGNAVASVSCTSWGGVVNDGPTFSI